MKKQADRGRKEVEPQRKGDSNAKYKRLSIQRVTSKEISGPLYRTIY